MASRNTASDRPPDSTTPVYGTIDGACLRNSSARDAEGLVRTSKDVLETQKSKAVDSPRPVEDGQRVIARPEDDKQLSVSAGEA